MDKHIILVLNDKNHHRLWSLNQTSQFIKGFLIPALLWNRDNTEYYFLIKIDGMPIAISTDYNNYTESISNWVFVNHPYSDDLQDLLESEIEPGYYGIIISTLNHKQQVRFMGFKYNNPEFLQGLLSAVDTFDMHHILKYKIYRDGIYYDIVGRDLIMPGK